MVNYIIAYFPVKWEVFLRKIFNRHSCFWLGGRRREQGLEAAVCPGGFQSHVEAAAWGIQVHKNSYPITAL